MIMMNRDQFLPPLGDDAQLSGALRCLGSALGALHTYKSNMPHDGKSCAAQALKAIEQAAQATGGELLDLVNQHGPKKATQGDSGPAVDRIAR